MMSIAMFCPLGAILYGQSSYYYAEAAMENIKLNSYVGKI